MGIDYSATLQGALRVAEFSFIICLCIDFVLLLRRMQALKEPVYTQKEAEMAAGMGNYVLQKPDTSFTDVDMTERNGKDLNKETRTI